MVKVYKSIQAWMTYSAIATIVLVIYSIKSLKLMKIMKILLNNRFLKHSVKILDFYFSVNFIEAPGLSS